VATQHQNSGNNVVPPGWPSNDQFNGQDFSYGMDPDVFNNPLYSPAVIQDALKSIPSISIVTDQANLTNQLTGIYVNPGQDSIAWERPASVELINPDGSEGFQINAGIRIRGGFSRDPNNPKHALRLFFREEYGASKLNYPLFGDEGPDEYDKIDLRTGQNYSWSYQNDGRMVLTRDIFSRDTQRGMGEEYTRGKAYHLYLNGQYWGLYQSQERAEASFGETYFGGSESDYDVIKVEAGPYDINATDGNMTAWTNFWTTANTIPTQPGGTPAIIQQNRYSVFMRLQGKNPDGTDNPTFPVYLDVDNMINYWRQSGCSNFELLGQ
jgi:hypothetical protein